MKNDNSEASIKVWDGVVRLFHWSLVLLFTTSYITSESGMQNTHLIAGYALVVIILVRIFWGFVGTTHARFKSFIFSPATIFSYIKSILANKPERHLGHNPAGGVMVVALLISLIVMTVSGFILEASIEFEGPFVYLLSDLSDQTVYQWQEIHEETSEIMLILILLHLVGVAVASIQHKESLVRAMITGHKPKHIHHQG